MKAWETERMTETERAKETETEKKGQRRRERNILFILFDPFEESRHA